MVNDEVSVYNLALNAIGARDNVTITSEASREAEVCRLWYPVVRDQILRAAHWPSTRKAVRLAQLAQASGQAWTELDPEPGYQYAYGQPDDMLYPRSLSNYSPFIVNNYNGIPAITTNEYQAILIYTFRQLQVSRWEASLQSAIVFGLAAFICMPLTGKPKRAAEVLNQANSIILQARTEAANEGGKQLDTMPDWLAGRGYAEQMYDGPTSVRYLYPFGSTLGIANVS